MKSKSWPTILWPWALIIIVGLLAYGLRVVFIEPPSIEHQCDGGVGPAWCGLRQWIVLSFLNYGYGYVALTAATLALFWKNAFAAWLAASLGVFALIMYCGDGGALALLVGCLCLVRAQTASGTTRGEQHRQTDRQIQAQP